MDDPSYVLEPPTAGDQPVPSSLDSVLHLADYASLGHWAVFLLKKATGLTPVGEVDLSQFIGQAYAGDWTSVATAGAALDNLSAFSREAASGVRFDTGRVTEHWTGLAADAAEQYFDHLAKELVGVQEALREMGATYDEIAFGVWENAKAVGSVFEMIIDLAIVAGIAAAVDAALGSTGVAPGAAAMTVVLALDIGALVAKILEIIGLIGTAVTIIESFTGQLVEAGAVLDRFRRLELPKEPYDHKLVD